MMNFIPHTEKDRQEMLAAVGAGSVEELFADIPEAVRFKRQLKIPGPLSEPELVHHLGELAARNADPLEYTCFLGAGAYKHYIPRVIDHMLLRSEFYTAYTPYQPEISQGTLQAIFQYQTMVCELTGMDVANASMYDGASALAEAALMACDATRREEILVSATVHPEYRQVLATYARGPGLKVAEISYREGVMDLGRLKAAVSDSTACVIFQQPNFFGCLEEVDGLAELVHGKGALLVVCVDPISLGLLKPPGDYGADIVVGEGQAMGNPVSYGGPFLGFFACREKLVRRMPGRIVGETVDQKGRRGYVLTLQAREQHIRREKATSNICSNEALCALAATIYLTLTGKRGLPKVAGLCLQKAHYAYKQVTALPGFDPGFRRPFFKEFVVKTPVAPAVINKALLQSKIIGGLDLGRFYPELAGHQLYCITEIHTKEKIDTLIRKLEEIK